MSVRLGVNVDHVATLRQARRTAYPEPVLAALLAEQGGADGITVHLRGDRRHIQERDLQVLRATVQTQLNCELAVTSENIEIALTVKPDQVTFVPERADELTTEGGLELVRSRLDIRRTVDGLHDAGIGVAIFIDPDLDQIKAAHRLGCDGVEFNTGVYCDLLSPSDRQVEVDRIGAAARMAARLGLRVAAGHGLNLHNAAPLAALSDIEEFNIGHAIMARALFCGMEQATRPTH
jgi:pyridoxine 5-phosphate synthase